MQPQIRREKMSANHHFLTAWWFRRRWNSSKIISYGHWKGHHPVSVVRVIHNWNDPSVIKIHWGPMFAQNVFRLDLGKSSLHGGLTMVNHSPSKRSLRERFPAAMSIHVDTMYKTLFPSHIFAVMWCFPNVRIMSVCAINGWLWYPSTLQKIGGFVPSGNQTWENRPFICSIHRYVPMKSSIYRGLPEDTTINVPPLSH